MVATAAAVFVATIRYNIIAKYAKRDQSKGAYIKCYADLVGQLCWKPFPIHTKMRERTKTFWPINIGKIY